MEVFQEPGGCDVSPQQEATGENLHLRIRGLLLERHSSPEPVKMKHLGILSIRIDPGEEQVSSILRMEEAEASVEDLATADHRMAPAPDTERNPVKNSQEAEELGIKRDEKKAKKPPKEPGLQTPNDGVQGQSQREKNMLEVWRTE